MVLLDIKFNFVRPLTIKLGFEPEIGHLSSTRTVDGNVILASAK